MSYLGTLLGSFHLLRPWWLLLLSLIPLLLLLDDARRGDAGGWRGVVAPHLLSRLLVFQGRRPRLRPAPAAAVLFAVLALALSGPSWRREPNPFVDDPAPMVVALDLSRAAASALATGKRKIRDLVALRAGARTGLVAYAGTAHAVLPPTNDPKLIATYLAALAPAMMPRDGDAAAAAASVARHMLDDQGGAGTVVFVTPAVPTMEAGAFRQAMAGSRHAVLVLATGPGPFSGAAGGSVVRQTPDNADVTRIAARAQRHFSLAAGDDPASRWHDEGLSVALLAMPIALLWARRGVLAGLVFAMLIGAQPARASGWNWFSRLWSTPDQRAWVLLRRGDPAGAAGLFTDPMWRGVALYRAGDYGAAAAAFGLCDTPEAQYDRGNAFMMRPQGWNEAIPAYDRALQLRPDFVEARDNRAIALAFQRRQQAAEAQRRAEQTDQTEHPEEGDTVVDQGPQQDHHDNGTQQAGKGRSFSDDQIQALWMRRVSGTPTDFLRLRFAREAEEPRK